MRWSLLALAAISTSPLVMFSLVGIGGAKTPDGFRVSDPIVHENLAIYFIHGKSETGKVPLTLEEAMARGVVRVKETSNVNQLEMENLGTEEVFVQSGDIVKGGKQDRTLMVSLVLPPHSGSIPIASFCVEQGRWSPRGREDAHKFSTASAAVPSREMKLAMKAPLPVAPAGDRVMRGGVNAFAAETGVRQQQVWDGVQRTQAKLTDRIGESVRSSQSASSLQLALENERLIDVQKGYINALKAAGENGDDIVGFVFAINGQLNSADVYPSNGLFRKMWTKLLTASAIEAIGHKDEPNVAPPSTDAVTAFIAAAEAGKASEKALNAGVKLETRDSDKAYYFETARASAPSPGTAPSPASAWVHRNYLAK
jgi:hypothetical protein